MSDPRRKANDGGSGSGDVPSWILTYSDVITLLMTFFVLLLTFSTDQIERFERMRVSLLGGNRGTGIVTEMPASLDYDELVWRERPRIARSAPQGSRSPPRFSDPALIAVGKGLKSLNEPDRRPIGKSHVLALPLRLLLDGRGRVTPVGARMLSELANRVRSLPYLLEVQVAGAGHLAEAAAVVEFLAERAALRPASLAVGVRPGGTAELDKIWIVLERQ